MSYLKDDIIRDKDDPRATEAIGQICYSGDTLKEVMGSANSRTFYRTETEVSILDGLGWSEEEDGPEPEWIDEYPFRFKMTGGCFMYRKYIIPIKAKERIYEPDGQMYAAFMNRKTGLLVGRTDRENGKVRQVSKCYNPPVISDIWGADIEMRQRQMNPRDYKIVRIRIMIEEE